MARSAALIDVIADTSRTEAQMERGFEAAIRQVERAINAVNVDAAVSRETEEDVIRRMQDVINQASDAIGAVDVNASIDPDTAGRMVDELDRIIVNAQNRIRDIDVAVDERELQRDLNEAIEDAEDQAPTIEIETEIDEDELNRFGSSLAAVGGIAGSTLASLSALTAGVAALAGAVGAATVGVSSLVSSLGGVDGAASQAAAGIGIYRTANVLLRVSLIGVAEAFQAAFGEAEDFEEALEKLSPEAQRVARDFRDVTPEITGFQQSLQDSLFSQIESEQAAKDLGSALDEIEPAAEKVTAAFGDIINRLIEFAVSDEAVEDFKTVIEATAPAVERFGDIVLFLAERALSNAADGTDELGDTMGRLEGFARTVYGAMKDVGDILGSVGEAADRTGATLEFSLVKGLDAAADALNTDAGENFLDSLLGLASAITSTVVPALGTLALAMLPLIDSFADGLTPAVEALQEPLQTLIGSLSTGLQPVVEALDPVLLNLATSAGDVAVAFAPLLPILGDLASLILPVLNPVIDFLRRILLALAPVVVSAARAFSALFSPALERLPEIVDAVLRPLADMAEQAMPQIASAIREATPSLQRLGELFAENIDNLLPLIEDLIRLATEALPQVIPPLLELFPYLIQLATLYFDVSNAISDDLVPALSNVTTFIDRTVNTSFASLAVSVGAALTEIVRDAAGLTPGSQRAMLPFPPALGRIGDDAARRLVNAMSDGFDRAVSLARSLAGRVQRAMGNLGRVLYNSGRALVDGFIDGMLSLLGAVADAANSVVDAAADFFPGSPAKEGPFSGHGYTPFRGQALAEDFAKGIEQNTAPATRAAAELATAAASQITPVNIVPMTARAMAGIPAPTSASQAAAQNITLNVQLTNRGVLGSRVEVMDWLAQSLDELRRTRRLPIGATR